MLMYQLDLLYKAIIFAILLLEEANFLKYG